MVSLRPGSAMGLRISTSSRLATFHGPRDSMPKKEKYSDGTARRNPARPPTSLRAEYIRKPNPQNNINVWSTSVYTTAFNPPGIEMAALAKPASTTQIFGDNPVTAHSTVAPPMICTVNQQSCDKNRLILENS